VLCFPILNKLCSEHGNNSEQNHPLVPYAHPVILDSSCFGGGCHFGGGCCFGSRVLTPLQPYELLLYFSATTSPFPSPFGPLPLELIAISIHRSQLYLELVAIFTGHGELHSRPDAFPPTGSPSGGWRQPKDSSCSCQSCRQCSSCS
jgi:hypothetical protein